MISKIKLQAEPLHVSLNGQLKSDQTWVIFDHYQFENDQLFLIGLTLDDQEKRVVFQDVSFRDSSLEHSITFLESKLYGMSQALDALKKIENEKGLSNDNL